MTSAAETPPASPAPKSAPVVSTPPAAAISADEVAALERACAEFRLAHQRLRDEIAKVIVGHREVVDGVLTCLFVGGHALLEGVPGLGKTMLIRTLAEALSLKFNRVQFTPDLMPADILGTNVVMETPDGRRSFQFVRGPIFSQIVLADEINRATPKTQSALLEAMQEQSVTVGGTIYQLDKPFFVMATQNPVEQEGTYPLPEAQLDRFLFKLVVGYSSRDEMKTILDRTTTGFAPQVAPVIDGPGIIAFQKLVRRVVVAPHVQDYAIRLILATHPGGALAIEPVNRFLRFGSSPRGAQALILAAKVRALADGRYNVSFADIRAVCPAALRHRCLLNFEGEAEGIKTDTILAELLTTVPENETLPAASRPRR